MAKSKKKNTKTAEKLGHVIAQIIDLIQWKYVCWIAVAVVLLFLGYRSGDKQDLTPQITALQEQQENLKQQIEKLREVQAVYVFNLEKVVEASDLVLIQKDFENQVLKLSSEVDKAKKKISNLKKSKVNEDFSDVYLKSLTLKRDELMEKHEKEMAEVTQNINKALAKVAEEKNAPAIFHMSAIAATTGHVIDVSDDVVVKINELLKKSQ